MGLRCVCVYRCRGLFQYQQESTCMHACNNQHTIYRAKLNDILPILGHPNKLRSLSSANFYKKHVGGCSFFIINCCFFLSSQCKIWSCPLTLSQAHNPVRLNLTLGRVSMKILHEIQNCAQVVTINCQSTLVCLISIIQDLLCHLYYGVIIIDMFSW